MNYQSLNDLYFHELRDLYSAEKQLLRALPKIVRHLTSEDLRQTLQEHMEETRLHVERLEDILERHGRNGRNARCRAMEGLIEECDEWLDEEASAEVMDAGIIALAQRIKHYEIAGYGCARTYAGLLGFSEDEAILNETLLEEHRADGLLTAHAEEINQAANVIV